MNTEEVAVFNSCSAYQSLPQLLYLSHCVPYPPNKGEKIRAYHEIRELAARYRVHLVCFAKSAEEAAHARTLEHICASVYVVRLRFVPAIARAGYRFALGRCLTTSFYDRHGVRRYIRKLSEETQLFATVVYSSAMAPLAPKNVPAVVDFVDVDSEKWRDYAARRWPGFLFELEARRLRECEIQACAGASAVFLATRREVALLRSFVPATAAQAFENGVDAAWFDPEKCDPLADLQGRRCLVFTGMMNYFPNAEGVCWFVREVWPEMRRQDPFLRFVIVGRNPSADVRRLASVEGVTVTGAVDDVRPYLAAATAVVAPLQTARGIQNKVLEALAMGKPVLASGPVCATFEPEIPPGLLRCDCAADYAAAVREGCPYAPCSADIRAFAEKRFAWRRNLGVLLARVAALEPRTVQRAARTAS